MLDTVGVWLQSAYALSVLSLGLAWALAPALARRAAAVRHHMWAVALAIAIVAPVVRTTVPRLSVPLLPPEDVVRPLQPARVTTAAAPRSSTSREPHIPSSTAWSATAIAALVWILGAVPLLCLRGLRRTRLSRLVADASVVDGQVDVRSHARVGVPMLAGLWRPTILLPPSVAEWPIDTRDAVLVHERAHIQRYDHVMALLSDVVTTLYWLNPLAWMAAAALEREREAACDEEVLRAGVKPSVYAAVLLTVADMLPARRAATVPSIAGGRLEARIRAVLKQAPHSGRVPLSWPATIALIGVCALLAGNVRLVARTPPQAVLAEHPTPARVVAASAAAIPPMEPKGQRRLPRAAVPSPAPTVPSHLEYQRAVHAQGATIAGVATDAVSGAPLPGVTVNVASGVLTEGSRIATTDGDGIYRVADLPAGTYRLEFRLAEYSTVMRDQLEVTIDTTATVDVAMKEARIRD